jgi:glycosyltransferase involved in cell wall biosynthesis
VPQAKSIAAINSPATTLLWQRAKDGACRLIPRLTILTEIIAPYRIPGFNALARRTEIDSHVIFLSENDPGLRQWLVYKNEIEFKYEVLPSWRRRLGGHKILFNRGVFSALRRIKPTIILCGGYNYPASWQAAVWARFHSAPLLLWSESTVLDVRQGHRLVEFIKGRFVGLCAGFVVPGKSSFHYLKELGVGEKQIFVAPNAIDTNLFSALAEVARNSDSRDRHSLPQRYFLYVGRLVRAKGVFDLMEAYARLEDDLREGVGLVFVGDGADRSKLMQQAQRIAPGEIQFTGFIHRNELPAFYAASDALIFPTHSDTWGMVVNEAMACGLPVVVADVAGCAADLVQNGWNGFTVRSGNIGDLTSAMKNLASNPEMRQAMRLKSRERIDAYSPAAWADGVIKAVESLSPRNPSSRNP